MGETDEELRARIEARINARRDQLRTGGGDDDPVEVETAPTGAGGEADPDPENPMAREQIIEPSRAWGAPQGSATPNESPSGNPWLTGTAPSVREAQQRAAELEQDERPIGTAAALRPRRPWVKESDQDAATASARPEVHRRPVSFVPAEEPAEFPHREAQTRRELRQQRRAEKAQQKAAGRVTKETPEASQDVPPVYQAPVEGRHITASGEPHGSDAWTTPTYGLPQTPVNVPVPETPMSAPDPDLFLEPHPRYAAEPTVQYGPPPEAMPQTVPQATPEPAREPVSMSEPEFGSASRYELTPEPMPEPTPGSEFAPPPSWGPPAFGDAREVPDEVPAQQPAEQPADEPAAAEVVQPEAPASTFPAFELPVAPTPPTDFRAELAALRAQIAELAQELSAAPIPPSQSSQAADSGGLFRRNRSNDQGPDETS